METALEITATQITKMHRITVEMIVSQIHSILVYFCNRKGGIILLAQYLLML